MSNKIVLKLCINVLYSFKFPYVQLIKTYVISLYLSNFNLPLFTINWINYDTLAKTLTPAMIVIAENILCIQLKRH